MAETYKVFIGGGGDDWFSHIVENYRAEYEKANPRFRVPYYSWTEAEVVRLALNLIPADANVTVVGHSYGADCAFGAVWRCNRVVDTLISIDPVGRIRPSWANIRSKCRRWLNVRAEPSAANRTFDDRIASWGGQYPSPPAVGQPGAPDYALVADATHGAFAGMMRTTGPQGVSGRRLLGGVSVR